MVKMNKKGIELTLNTVVIAIIVLVVMAVMLLIFSSLIKRGGADPLNCAAKLLNTDSDSPPDGVKDAVDPCPCDSRVPKECIGPLEEQPSGCQGKGGQCSGGDSCLPAECRS